jgi:hypothetical protein
MLVSIIAHTLVDFNLIQVNIGTQSFHVSMSLSFMLALALQEHMDTTLKF